MLVRLGGLFHGRSARPLRGMTARIAPRRAFRRAMTVPITSHLLYVAAQLGLADHLNDGPRNSGDMARLIGADARTLHRVMRGLVAAGLLSEDADGRFALTPVGAYLRSDIPGSLRGQIVFEGELARAWSALPHTVRTGENAFRHVFGLGIFDHFARNPAVQAYVARTQGGAASRVAASLVVASYNFAGVGTVVDVGGGRGTLLAAILRAHPTMRGVLFDRPGVVAEARDGLEAAGLGSRCDIVAGDFFQSVPAGGDAYALRRIIHDWDDEQALRILAACRQAMAGQIHGQGRLLLIERVMPERVEQAPAVVVADLIMLVETGGRERTVGEYRALLAAAGFRLSRLTAITGQDSVIEAQPIGS